MTDSRDRSSSIPVVVNSRAGLGPGGPEGLVETAREAGVDVRIIAVEPEKLADAIRRAAGESRVVGVAGGDGTLRTAAEVLAGRDNVLAAIPAGTLNHFTRRQGISRPAEAFEAIAHGVTRPVALGVANHRLFLNTAIIGLYSDLVRKRERLRRWITKWPAAVVSGLALLVRMPLLDVTLQVEGTEEDRLSRSTPLVWIGLGSGSFPFVHEASEPRGRCPIEVAIVRPVTRRGVVWLGIRMLARLVGGRPPSDLEGIEFYRARQLLLSASGKVGVTLDGEPFRSTSPILLRVQDEGLRVVVRPETETEPG